MSSDSSNSNRELTILIPVFKDWPSCFRLICELNNTLASQHCYAKVVIVDDGSLENDAPYRDNSTAIPYILSVRILRLNLNLGHQRALAIGLSALADEACRGPIVVMDADGEDSPADIPRLLQASEHSPDTIVFARRDRRSEGVFFSFFYWLYCSLFWLLTGVRIQFGNFCLIPSSQLMRLVSIPSIWNHLAASILQAKMPWESVPTDRGQRYFGRSRMNFISMVLHGLSAISVYLEIVCVRLLITAATFCVLVAASFVGLLYVKLGTSLAIPGWATSAAMGLAIIGLQSILFVTLLTFIILNNRSRRADPGLVHEYKRYVSGVDVLK